MDKNHFLGIDLGSNSLKFSLMNAKFEVLKTDEFGVLSALNLKENLSNTTKNKIILALEKLWQDWDLKNSVAVATEAFRVANDSEEFFKFLETKFGVKFKIISSFKECELSRLAVLKRCEMLKIPTKNLALVDLGGGSCEISLDKVYKSFKFGIVKIFNDFKNLKEIKNNAKFITNDANKFLKKLNPENIVLNATIARNLLNLKQTYESSNSLNFSDFAKLQDLILNKKVNLKNKTINKTDEIDEDDLLLCGIYLYENILRDFEKFIIIDYGLKEGVIIDEILKNQKGKL